MPTPKEQAHWNEQQRLLKENLKAQIDRMLITNVDYTDLDVSDDDLPPQLTIRGRWLDPNNTM